LKTLSYRYFFQFWNYIDFLNILFFIWYYQSKIRNSGGLIPDIKNAKTIKDNMLEDRKLKKTNPLQYDQKLIEPAFNLLLTFLAFLKMLFYLRLFEQFGSIVSLTI